MCVSVCVRERESESAGAATRASGGAAQLQDGEYNKLYLIKEGYRPAADRRVYLLLCTYEEVAPRGAFLFLFW